MTRRKLLKKKNNRYGLGLVIAGALLLLSSFLWRIHSERILSFTTSDSAKLESGLKKGDRPVKVVIPSLGVNLEIKEAVIANGVWQVWETAANHLASSANPGSGGNIVIYAHNKNTIFGPIRGLRMGQTVELIDEKGTKYLYKVEKVIVTSPKNISYVLPKDTETLTLYTCTGIFDSQRFVVVAKRL